MSNSVTAPVQRNGHRAVTLEECYFFTRQLHVLQKAGVPLLSSLSALQAQLPEGTLKRILRDVHQRLLEGRTFSQALGRHPKTFNPVVLSLIRVGEAGGLLDEVLRQLSQLFEWELDVRRRLREALQYPAIVLVTLAVAMTLMVTFVLPRFATLFRSFHVDLPLQTRLLIALSGMVSRYGWFMLAALSGLVVALWGYARSEPGRLRWHTWLLRLPVIGPLALQCAMSRFARVTAVLTRSGVPILETLALATESVNNKCVQQALRSVRDRIRGGEALSSALSGQGIFAPVVVQMVATGEQTGHLDELLQSVSEYYDQQVTYLVKKVVASIEPTIILLVGAGVLMMASAVLVPMWDLVKVFKHTGG